MYGITAPMASLLDWFLKEITSYDYIIYDITITIACIWQLNLFYQIQRHQNVSKHGQPNCTEQL
jgi:hypothetical protein